MTLKKGAMFGLDARIALAIFGALSVISGASLYSAIGNAKATTLLTDMQEIGKAWEQYYLDTGEMLPRVNTADSSLAHFYLSKTSNLAKNPGIKGWSGPYLNYSIDPVSGGGSYLLYDEALGYHIHLTYANENNWTSGLEDGFCSSGDNCYIWVRIYTKGQIDSSLAAKIDEMVDGSDGRYVGDFKWDNGYNLKYMPVKNPNN